MACACGKKKKETDPAVMPQAFATLSVKGENTLVAARAAVVLGISGRRPITLKTGQMVYVPAQAAQDLINQGAPLWTP